MYSGYHSDQLSHSSSPPRVEISNVGREPFNVSSTTEILTKALEGRSITQEQACELLSSGDLDSILVTADRIRHRTKLGRIVTYSRKVFINLVNLCRDSCSYCTYKKEPGDALLSMLDPSQTLAIAEMGKKYRCTEALIVTGERPEQKYAEARAWLKSTGHSSTIEYIADISETILRKTGLLPHTNSGSLTKKEMRLLKATNVSLGVMLESSSERLTSSGMAHEHAPSKNPKVRMRTIEGAGELKIPMTTGLLVGIGETQEELVDSLFSIKSLSEKYGHIQEVIMQNFAPKTYTGMAQALPATPEFFLKTVALSRIVMPEMNIQVPPNLNPKIFGNFLDAGINDWGGISPVTIDHVNPEFQWPTIEMLKEPMEKRRYTLRARLPVYPEFFKGKALDGFISERLQNYINFLADETGLVKEEYINWG